MVRRATILFVLCGCLFAALSARAGEAFDGYVTSVASSSEFDVGQRHVTCDAHTKWQRPAHPPEYLASPRVGMRVFVKGESRHGAFVATEVNLDPRKIKAGTKLEGRALIEQAPQMHPDADRWAGTLWVDGYPLLVTWQTNLVTPDGTEVAGDKITTNLWATYQGVRGSDGAIAVDHIIFEPNTVDADEKEFRDQAEPEIIPADPAKHKAAKLKFHAGIPTTWGLVADQEVQDYVTRVGTALVPQYQRDLPASDPTKINFRFYAIDTPGWVGQWRAPVDLASGVILIPDDMLVALDNEAQLAAWISSSIAHVLEKQDYLNRRRMRKDQFGALASLALLAVSPLASGAAAIPSAWDTHHLFAEINERCDRIGLTYMLRQGYDIRVAPFAYAIGPEPEGDERTRNPFDPDHPPPARTTKLMEELQFDYATTNYATSKKGREDYAAIKLKAQADFK